MRGIVFRGKRTDNGQWVQGYLSCCVVAGEAHICRVEENLSTTIHRVDPETVCQYTGLDDRRGKRIYEGDIVYIGDEDGNFAVLWDDYAAGFIMEGEYARADFISYPGVQVKVIGNIFDNPELKEEQDEDEND